MEYRAFGELEVVDGRGSLDLGGRKQRAVLAVLVLDAGRAVSAGTLIDRVWGERPPPSAATSLQAYISNLRRVVEPDRRPRSAATVLVTRPAGYALLAERAAIDVARFEDGAARGHALLAAGDTDGAAQVLDRALAEWRGPLLPELDGDHWVHESRAHLDRLRSQAVADRLEAGLRLGRHLELIPRLEQAIVDDPYREPLRAMLAVALYRSGRQRDALAALNAARADLVEQVGVEPGPELRRLEADILAQSPDLDLPERSSAAPTTAVPAHERADDPTGAPPRAPVATPFLGRDRELALLRDAHRWAAQGRGRAAIVTGEPGIGKSRLVEELVAAVPDAIVAWGRCRESGAHNAYWPWLQIAHQLDGAGALSDPLLADLADANPDGTDPAVVDGATRSPSDDAAGERWALHVGAARSLASAKRPVIAVIEDAQWADPASLRLGEFLAGELRQCPVLLIVTTRPVRSAAPPALVDLLGELARQPDTVRIDLAGLSDADIVDWIRHRGVDDDSGVAAAVHDRTGGNPFFVSQVIELMAAEGRLHDPTAVRGFQAVPEAVHIAIRRRVARLPVVSQQLLAIACVVGRTFDVDVVADVADPTRLDVLDALDALDPAIEAGVIEPTDVPGRLQFTHALVADALVAELSPGRRARLHAATARSLERLRAADLDSHLTDLAHHALAGAGAGTAELAYRWSVAAAHQCVARLAHDDAAEHWGAAVRALELARPADREARAVALLEQGAAYVKVDDIAAGFGALTQVIDLALGLDRTDLLLAAMAAMNVLGVWQTAEVSGAGGDFVAAVERAVAALPTDPSAERVLALGAAVDAAYWHWPVERLDAVSSQAVEEARRLGDPPLLARTLQKRGQAMWWSATIEERARIGAELLAMADDDLQPPELQALARFSAASALWDRGDTAATRRQVEQARALTAQRGGPALATQLDFFLAAIGIVQGRLAEAEQLAQGAYELYRVTRRWAAEAVRAGFLVSCWLDQDRLADIRAVAPPLLDTPYRPWYKEVYGLVLVEHGCLDEAASVCAELPPLTDSWLHSGTLAVAAHVRVALGDVVAAETLHTHLAPLAGRMANLGTGPAFGDIDLALGAIERLRGDDDAARRHLDSSVAMLSRASAGPFLARALLLRAELDGGTPGEDRQRAAAIIDRLGLRLLRHRLNG